MKTFIFGMGDQSRYVKEILQLRGHANIVTTLWPTDETISEEDCGIIAIGDNFSRAKVHKLITEKYPNFRFIYAVHPSCIGNDEIMLPPGMVAMAGCIFNIGAKIGAFTFFATGAQIEHDCEIGDYASVSAGSVLGGHVKVEEFAAVTLGCTVFDRVTIGRNSVVGSGSLVTKDVLPNSLVYGSPAKYVRHRSLGERFLK